MRQITTERPTQHHEVWPTPYHAMVRSGQKMQRELIFSLLPPTLLSLTDSVTTQKSLGNISAQLQISTQWNC